MSDGEWDKENQPSASGFAKSVGFGLLSVAVACAVIALLANLPAIVRWLVH